jgi:hypothetical protein
MVSVKFSISLSSLEVATSTHTRYNLTPSYFIYFNNYSYSMLFTIQSLYQSFIRNSHIFMGSVFPVIFVSLFYDAFSVTRQYSVYDRVTNEWLWWIDEDKHPCLKRDWNPRSQRPRPMPQTARLQAPATSCHKTLLWRCLSNDTDKLQLELHVNIKRCNVPVQIKVRIGLGRLVFNLNITFHPNVLCSSEISDRRIDRNDLHIFSPLYSNRV